jgi:hypothetical protein
VGFPAGCSGLVATGVCVPVEFPGTLPLPLPALLCEGLKEANCTRRPDLCVCKYNQPKLPIICIHKKHTVLGRVEGGGWP